MSELTLQDFKPTLHNDISIDEAEIYTKHNNLIKMGAYKEATALLNENNIDGIRASLFNSWEVKLNYLDELLSKKEFKSPYFYSQSTEEPTVEEFAGKSMWSQIY